LDALESLLSSSFCSPEERDFSDWDSGTIFQSLIISLAQERAAATAGKPIVLVNKIMV
jgi:hypothetical protein